MVDQLQEWQSDPAGKHRFRLHADGQPTDWVSDGTTVIHDPLPPAQDPYPPAPDHAVVAGPSPQSWSAQPSAGGAVEAPAPVSEPARPAGWYRSAANPSEVRYWDGSQWTTSPDDQPGGPPVTNGRGDLVGSEPPPHPGDGHHDLSGTARPHHRRHAGQLVSRPRRPDPAPLLGRPRLDRAGHRRGSRPPSVTRGSLRSDAAGGV